MHTTTIEYDYSALGLAPGNTIGDLRIGTNNNQGGATYYFDNYRVVPEPASAGVLAVGALTLLARRRRNR